MTSLWCIWDFNGGDRSRSGRLLNFIRAHHRRIQKLVYAEPVGLLLSTGYNGKLLGWQMTTLLDRDRRAIKNSYGIAGIPEDRRAEDNGIPPWCSFSKHQMPITDVRISSTSSSNCRVYTGSLDKILRVYHLPSSSLLYSMIFPS